MEPKKRILKIVVVGDSCVGKTSLMIRYVESKFTNSYECTIGAPFLKKEIMLENSKVTLQLWDTAGGERFNSLGSPFYRHADVCIIAFDITNLNSFDRINDWKNEFLLESKPCVSSSFPFFIVGTKVDLADARQVTVEKAKTYCKSIGIPYFEVSAKEDINIDHTFNCIAKEVLGEGNSDIEFPTHPPVTLDDSVESTGWGNCCM